MGVQGPLRPEMRKLFLRISREDCQPLSAIVWQFLTTTSHFQSLQATTDNGVTQSPAA